jgi:hypothetical protein
MHAPAGGLSDEERKLIDLYPLRSAKKILHPRPRQDHHAAIVAAYESKVDYAIPRKSPTARSSW